jgi:hypothetical protein
MWAGIVMVAAGVALVLYSKEEAEEARKKATPPPVVKPTEPTPSATP